MGHCSYLNNRGAQDITIKVPHPDNIIHQGEMIDVSTGPGEGLVTVRIMGVCALTRRAIVQCHGGPCNKDGENCPDRGRR